MTPEVEEYLIFCQESLQHLRAQYGAGHELVRGSLAGAGGVLTGFRISKALTEAEFDDWTRRVGEAAGLVLPPPGPSTGMQAAAFAKDPPKASASPGSEAQCFLEDGLQHVRRVRDRGPDDRPVHQAVTRLLGSVEAMHVAGLLTTEEMVDWMHLVDATADGRGGRLENAPYSPGMQVSLGGARAMLGPIPGAPPAPPPPPPPPVPKFIRMVPGHEGELEFYGGRLSIMGVELFDDHASILWRLSPPPQRGAVPGEKPPADVDMTGLPETERARIRTAGRSHRMPWLASRFQVTDDVGTEYGQLGSMTSSGSVETGTIDLTPAPPPGATELTIDAIGVTIRLPLLSRNP